MCDPAEPGASLTEVDFRAAGGAEARPWGLLLDQPAPPSAGSLLRLEKSFSAPTCALYETMPSTPP